MLRRGKAPRFAALAALTLLCPRAALAHDRSCSRLDVHADAAVAARWPALTDRVRTAFDERGDVDQCARVALRERSGAIDVTVALPDGRAASRTVPPGDVVPTLEALLLLPERSEDGEGESADAPAASLPTPAKPASRESSPAPESVAPPAPSSAVATPTPRRVAIEPEHDAGPSNPDAKRLGIELSVVTGARVGDGQKSLGAGLLSFLDFSGWLVGCEGRADRNKTLSDERDGGAFEFAVLAGRRLRLGGVALDFSAGPAAAFQGTTTFETRPATGPPTSESTSSIAPRLLLGTRLDVAARSTVRAFVGIDGELGPHRVGSTDIPNAPRLPLWTLGLSLGLTVGT